MTTEIRFFTLKSKKERRIKVRTVFNVKTTKRDAQKVYLGVF